MPRTMKRSIKSFMLWNSKFHFHAIVITFFLLLPHMTLCYAIANFLTSRIALFANFFVSEIVLDVHM
jgi:hypothetical protein